MPETKTRQKDEEKIVEKAEEGALEVTDQINDNDIYYCLGDEAPTSNTTETGMPMFSEETQEWMEETSEPHPQVEPINGKYTKTTRDNRRPCNTVGSTPTREVTAKPPEQCTPDSQGVVSMAPTPPLKAKVTKYLTPENKKHLTTGDKLLDGIYTRSQAEKPFGPQSQEDH
jgi:hypothetical protein